MKKSELHFTFVNPNTYEATIKALKDMIIAHIIQEVEDEKLSLTKTA